MDALFLLDDACRIDMHHLSNLESGYQEDEQSHAEENADAPIPTVCVYCLIIHFSRHPPDSRWRLSSLGGRLSTIPIG